MSDPPVGDPPVGFPPVGDPPVDEPDIVIFKPISESKFIFNDEEYTIQVNISRMDGAKIYDYYPDTGERTINISVDNSLSSVKESFNNDITKVVNKEISSTYADLTLNFVIQTVLQAFLISQGLSRVEAHNYSNAWLINVYKA